ncbi:hypothetical protein [Candidatus Thiosymbion oneisti]|uniref:hypothetical protein n=1 Tax=Candidatus Thiosymbion oneisti TaxID=589554 RepID=UPI000A5FB983|nr:hypothetical protein [Candidatus Thiosymbion oneisti]
MQAIEVNKALNAWPAMARMIYVPHTEEEYDLRNLWIKKTFAPFVPLRLNPEVSPRNRPQNQSLVPQGVA